MNYGGCNHKCPTCTPPAPTPEEQASIGRHYAQLDELKFDAHADYATALDAVASGAEPLDEDSTALLCALRHVAVERNMDVVFCFVRDMPPYNTPVGPEILREVRKDVREATEIADERRAAAFARGEWPS